MQGISKETFLKAEDPKNRDAMLYDMLAGIAKSLSDCHELKEEVEGFKAQVSLVRKLFFGVLAIFTAVTAWLVKD